MHNLPDEIKKELACHRDGFDSFLEERIPVLVDFIDALEFTNPTDVLQNAENFVSPLDHFLKEQTISDDDKVWILTRLGYFIGEFLVQKLGGCWLLNENPESRTFMKYVVGKFIRINNAQAMVDPFFVANTYLLVPPSRSLIAILDELLAELKEA